MRGNTNLTLSGFGSVKQYTVTVQLSFQHSFLYIKNIYLCSTDDKRPSQYIQYDI